MLATNPNRIKQPSMCCTTCGKGYKTRTSLNKHSAICEYVYKVKNNKSVEIIEDELPNQSQMYGIILDLAAKVNLLTEKIEKQTKFIDRKKKKINVVEWLNTNMKISNPENIFDKLVNIISITEKDVEYLFQNDFYKMLNEIFERTIYNKNSGQEEDTSNTNLIPIYAFTQKSNILYVYNQDSSSTSTSPINPIWLELSKEKLIYFLNIVHARICKAMRIWKETNQDKMESSDSIQDLYNRALIKVMSISFREQATLSKVKNQIYNKMKTDMKSFIEYELEI